MSTPTLTFHGTPPPNPSEENGAVRFDEVSIAFEERTVLDAVSFRLARGETKAIFGIAGAGKSTILKLCIGLIRADSGRILLLGNNVTEMKEEDLFELR